MTDWIIASPAQVATAKALNDKERRLEPRRIDNPAHTNFGKYTLPTDIITAKGYERFATRINLLPTVTATAAQLFLPGTD